MMKMLYKNYRGEVAVRTLDPQKEVIEVVFEDSPFHGPAHILKAYDVDKSATRGYKLDDCDFLSAQSPAMTSVILERAKQVTKGRTAEEDAFTNGCGPLAQAGICYATQYANHENPRFCPEIEFPWEEKHWKPQANNRQNLVIAIALLLAELEAHDYLEAMREEDEA